MRRAAGQTGYCGSYIEHYLLPIIYPTGLTRDVQLVLGGLVVALNLSIYAIFLFRMWRQPSGRNLTPSVKKRTHLFFEVGTRK